MDLIMDPALSPDSNDALQPEVKPLPTRGGRHLLLDVRRAASPRISCLLLLKELRAVTPGGANRGPARLQRAERNGGTHLVLAVNDDHVICSYKTCQL